jgi:hypothetical protein
MRFDAESVRRLLAMIEPGAPVPGEAETLAVQIGSWPEMLAHLLLRRETFVARPEIGQALHRLAEPYRGGPLNRRPRAPGQPGNASRRDESQAALEVSLTELLAAEKAKVAVARQADAALRAHVQARPWRRFDLHHRMLPERG